MLDRDSQGIFICEGKLVQYIRRELKLNSMLGKESITAGCLPYEIQADTIQTILICREGLSGNGISLSGWSTLCLGRSSRGTGWSTLCFGRSNSGAGGRTLCPGRSSCGAGRSTFRRGRTGLRRSWCRLYQGTGRSIIGTASITVTAGIFIIIFFAIILDHQNGRTLCGGHDLKIMVDSPGKQSS